MKRAWIFLLSTVLVLPMTNGNATETPPGFLSSEFIFETAPFPSCHASTIVETKRGLVAAWFGGTREGAPDVGIWLSRCVDGQWTAPVEIANGVQPDGSRHPCWNPVLFQPKAGPLRPFYIYGKREDGHRVDYEPETGPLLLFYKVGPSPSKWWGLLRTSSDDGATWSDATRLPDGMLGPIKNKPVQLANGDILCPTSTESVEKPSQWRVHFERTSDLGKTWTKVAPASAPDGNEINAIQPSILIHGGGKLQAVGRTRAGKVFETWSDDGGKNWSPLALSALPNPNSGTDAVTLKDGRHLLVYNHTPKGRSPLNIAVSRDGKNWDAAFVLEREPGEYSYPAIIQTRDGRVHITYTWKRQRIRHVVVDPAKLEPKPM